MLRHDVTWIAFVTIILRCRIFMLSADRGSYDCLKAGWYVLLKLFPAYLLTVMASIEICVMMISHGGASLNPRRAPDLGAIKSHQSMIYDAKLSTSLESGRVYDRPAKRFSRETVTWNGQNAHILAPAPFRLGRSLLLFILSHQGLLNLAPTLCAAVPATVDWGTGARGRTLKMA